jgi:prevent-host-death family protein
MRRTLTTLDLRRQLGDVLNRVALRHDHFVIQRKGESLAAVVPIETLDQMEAFSRERALSAFRRLVPGSVTADEAMTLADEAKHKTRRRAPKRPR